MRKSIKVTLEAYEIIKRLKRDNESFSKLFLRLSKDPIINAKLKFEFYK